MTPNATPTLRHWIALLMLGLPMFMMATDFTAIFLAMPPMAADLAPTATQTLWIIHIGELIAAGTVITMGWLTGRIGPRSLLLMAFPLYAVSSALAAFAPNPETLLVARVLIGLAAAAVGPAAFAMLRWLFTSAKHYGIAFAVVMGAFPVGTALGPPLTGLLLENFWWGSAFLINVPVGAAALLGGLWLFPRTVERTTDRIDLTSVVVSIAAVMLAVYGLQEIADQGFSASYALAVTAAVVLGAWFARRQRRLDNPLLDPELFASPLLRMLTLYFVLVHLAFVAIDFVLIQHMQIVLEISPGTLGLFLVLPGIGSIVGTALTPLLTARMRPATAMASGIGVGIIGVLAILTGLTVIPGITLLATGMTIVSLGVSPTMVLAAQLMITSVPRHKAGPAASVQDIGASLGSAIGIMVLGSVSALMFGRGVRAGAPDGVSEAELSPATDSPGAAVALAEEIGGGRGDELLSVARDALTQGTVAAHALALAVAVLMLVVIVRALRGVQMPADDDPVDEMPDASVTAAAFSVSPPPQQVRTSRRRSHPGRAS